MTDLRAEIARALAESSRDDHSDAYWDAQADAVLGVFRDHLADEKTVEAGATALRSIDGVFYQEAARDAEAVLAAALSVLFPQEEKTRDVPL